MTTREQYKADAVLNASAYEALLNDKTAKAADTAASLVVLTDSIDKYNKQVTADVQAICLAAEKPMLHAVRLGFQDRLVKKVKLDQKTGVWTATVEIDEQRDTIDLIALNKAYKPASDEAAKSLFASEKFAQYIPSMPKMFSVAVAKANKDADADSKGFALTKAMLGINRKDMLGKPESILSEAGISADADPFSISALQKVVQVMADLLLGEDAPLIPRKYIRSMILLCTKEGKKLTYAMAKEAGVLRLFQKVVYAALHNVDFEEFKK